MVFSTSTLERIYGQLTTVGMERETGPQNIISDLFPDWLSLAFREGGCVSRMGRVTTTCKGKGYPPKRVVTVSRPDVSRIAEMFGQEIIFSQRVQVSTRNTTYRVGTYWYLPAESG